MSKVPQVESYLVGCLQLEGTLKKETSTPTNVSFPFGAGDGKVEHGGGKPGMVEVQEYDDQEGCKQRRGGWGHLATWS